MQKDKILRTTILSFLKGGNAYMPFNEIISDFPEIKMNEIFSNGTYSPWQLLEHIRITQWDILDFIQNPDYKELTWPVDYWPKKTNATKKDWEKTINSYENDKMALEKIVSDHKTDLYAIIPMGTGQTVLREILLVCNHTSYHLGEFSIMRQVMESWGKKH